MFINRLFIRKKYLNVSDVKTVQLMLVLNNLNVDPF